MMATKREAARLATLEAKVEERHDQNQRRFDELDRKVDGIATDVKVLLSSRSYTRGFWKAVLLVAGGAGSVAGLIVAVIALWK